MLNTYASTYQKTGHIRPHPPVFLDTVALVCTRLHPPRPDTGTTTPRTSGHRPLPLPAPADLGASTP